MRLDSYLADNNIVKSRSRASNLIAIGRVSINGQLVTKASYDVKDNDIVTVNDDMSASLGSYKLRHAIDNYALSEKINDKVCMDIGASNGGFSAVLLEHNPSKIYAVEVGECMLDDSVLSDSRVISKHKVNARYMTRDDISEICNIVTIDVSFIKLEYIMANLSHFIDNDTIIVALLKPQFELGKARLSKNGIVKNKKDLDKLLQQYRDILSLMGYTLKDCIPVPRMFDSKNIEYLLLIVYNRIA